MTQDDRELEAEYLKIYGKRPSYLELQQFKPYRRRSRFLTLEEQRTLKEKRIVPTWMEQRDAQKFGNAPKVFIPDQEEEPISNDDD